MCYRNAGLAAVVLSSFLSVLRGSAGAQLVEHDLLAPGDGLVTRDLGTSLEWLDVTLTQGLPLDQVLAGAGGYVADGWRLATRPEFCAFTNDHIGFYGESCLTAPFSAARPFSTNPPDESESIVAAGRVVELLGVTSENPVEGVLATVGWMDDGDLSDGEAATGSFIWRNDNTLASVNISENIGTDFLHIHLGFPNRGTFLVRVFVPLLEVAIDVRPDSDINPINPMSRGVIPVAILGSDSFDVDDVDVTTLAFGPAGAAPVEPAVGRLEDVNGDGLMDTLFHFRTAATGIDFGDVEACLSGETLGGAPLLGCDAILVVGSCGIGFELVLLLPLMWRHRSRRRLRSPGCARGESAQRRAG